MNCCGDVAIETYIAALAGNIDDVETKISEACARAGRSRSEVSLIAVSKTVDARTVAAASGLGLADFGENYVQPAASKVREVRLLGAEGPRFHMIGHLQRNKVGAALEVFDSLHSLDSVRLLEALEKHLAGSGREFPCFVEVNVSGEASKHGLQPDNAIELVEASLDSDVVMVEGLMTMAPFFDNPEKSRPVFAALRELAERINGKLGSKVLRSLSMGMTNDFEVAVEEGATHLRIGRAIFATD